MSARRSRLLLFALAAGGLLLCLALPELAEARVGGGESFGRGGGGGFGGGGGEALPIDLIVLLVHLAVRYPALGIPLTLGLVGFIMVRAVWHRTGDHQVHRSRRGPVPRASQVDLGRVKARQGPQFHQAPPPIAGLSGLREVDPALSLPVLKDYLVLVHRRAHEALGNRQWAALLPFVDRVARECLTQAHEGVLSVAEMVVGGVSLVKVERRGDYHHVYVHFDSTRLETLVNGELRRVIVQEQWTFRRQVGARSPRPEGVARLGCPSCGAAIDVTPMGTCRNCDTPIVAGQLQWQSSFIAVQSRRPAMVPRVSWTSGGEENSVHLPNLQAPDLAERMAQLQRAHPEFEPRAFGARVELVYRKLQAAWSANAWDQARPYVTDRMFQTLRFWIDRYRSHRLRNQLEEVELDRVRVVRVSIDSFYYAITVRIWGAMKDSVVDATGKVVGGNPKVARSFSEYWTFLRSAETRASTRGDALGCPSCGAPLEGINQAGICGYCDAKVTTGRFEWVLSRIEQPEAYRG